MARMSRLLGAVCLGAAVSAAVGAVVVTREYAPVHRSPAQAASATHGRVIVKLRQRATALAATDVARRGGPQAASTFAARTGLALKDGRVLNERTQVILAQGVDSATLAATLSQDADVEWAEVDQRRYVQAAPVNDPLYPNDLTATTPASGQWYLRAPDAPAEDSSGALNVSGVNIEPAWAITHGSSAVVVADVDTGITVHPDITGSAPGAGDSKLFAPTFSGTTASTPYGYDFVGYASGTSGGESSTQGLETANDGNLADPDPSDPGDWITAAEDAGTVDNGDFKGCGATGGGAEDSSWHGTQTAGILAAATNNGVGMAGTAYDTKLVPVRALGKCGGYDSDIIAAAEWAGGVLSDSSVPANIHPARVVNMSLGGSGSCPSVYVDGLTRLRNAGVIVVAAAGNDEGLAVDAPANCKPASTDADQTPIVVAVAALRHAGDKVGFSDLGPEVTIAAPGGNCVNTDANSACLYPILTTSNTGTTSPAASTYTTAFGTPSLGTSFATPIVSGTVALMMAAAPNITNAQVISLLKSTARPFPTTGGSAGTPACHAPNTTAQDECYCTTSTCGAGMLDAGRAVAAAAALATANAVIADSATTVAAGSSITLDGSGSTASAGATLSSYAWSITSGAASATLSATSGSSVTLTGMAAGTVVVQLTVTDSANQTATSTTTVTVTSASSGGGSTGGGSSGGGGGGAANPAWLLALAAAGLLLSPRRRPLRDGSRTRPTPRLDAER
jgi:serine protease